MKEITAEDKDKVLGWFYEADVNGNEVPRENKNIGICAILTNDGYIQNDLSVGVTQKKGIAGDGRL